MSFTRLLIARPNCVWDGLHRRWGHALAEGVILRLGASLPSVFRSGLSTVQQTFIFLAGCVLNILGCLAIVVVFLIAAVNLPHLPRLNRSLFVFICSGYFFALILFNLLEVHGRDRHGVDARLASIDLELHSALKTEGHSGALAGVAGASVCLRALGLGLAGSAWPDSDWLLGLPVAAGGRTQVEAYLPVPGPCLKYVVSVKSPPPFLPSPPVLVFVTCGRVAATDV
jgi:hypothetical protein